MEVKEEAAFHLSDYDYDLPLDRIAQAPAPRRESSRLLVLNRVRGSLEHRRFEDIVDYLKPGDVLVVNDTCVVPARLVGRKETGGRIELLVLDPYIDPDLGSKEGYTCLIKAAKATQSGSPIFLENGFQARTLAPAEEGKTRVQFLGSKPLLDILQEIGKVPLPPYIQRNGKETKTVEDSTSYQTVYACKPGAVAAPTAGLHFSKELIEEVRQRGVETASVTLHVGYGTFAPIRSEDIRSHQMHSEYAQISSETAERIEKAHMEGRRIVAVGTTSVRILEWTASRSGKIVPFSGLCNHYIYPGYRFGAVGAMITNFHLPKSTLLLLVSAFAGREVILDAYREAVREGYRFFSYGDAMLIL
jgi:S-adenosylmethionine:tRNA ribosyltransferase-isomerase